MSGSSGYELCGPSHGCRSRIRGCSSSEHPCNHMVSLACDKYSQQIWSTFIEPWKEARLACIPPWAKLVVVRPPKALPMLSNFLPLMVLDYCTTLPDLHCIRHACYGSRIASSRMGSGQDWTLLRPHVRTFVRCFCVASPILH